MDRDYWLEKASIERELDTTDELLGWLAGGAQLNDEAFVERLQRLRQQHKRNLHRIEDLQRRTGGKGGERGRAVVRSGTDEDLEEAYHRSMASALPKHFRNRRTRDPTPDSGTTDAQEDGASSAGSFISDSYFPLDGSWERDRNRQPRSARDILYPDDREFYEASRFGRDWTFSDLQALAARDAAKWSPGRITIPKPFTMTIRDEVLPIRNNFSRRFMEELAAEAEADREAEEAFIAAKRDFRARPVPASTALPLYQEKLEEAQDRRRFLREHAQDLTQALQEPFDLSGPGTSKRYHNQSSGEESERGRQGFRAQPPPSYLYRDPKEEQREERRKEIRRRRAKQMLAAAMDPTSSMAYSRHRCVPEYPYVPGPARPLPDFSTLHSREEELLRSAKAHRAGTIPRPFSFASDSLPPSRYHDHKEEVRKRHSEMRKTRSQSNLAPPVPSTRSNLSALLRSQAVREQMEQSRAAEEAGKRRIETEVRQRVMARLRSSDERRAAAASSRQRQRRSAAAARQAVLEEEVAAMAQRLSLRATLLEQQEEALGKSSSQARVNAALKAHGLHRLLLDSPPMRQGREEAELLGSDKGDLTPTGPAKGDFGGAYEEAFEEVASSGSSGGSKASLGSKASSKDSSSSKTSESGTGKSTSSQSKSSQAHTKISPKLEMVTAKV